MSIDMILGMAESQTQGIKNLVTKQNEAYTELQKSLAEFILQTDKLKGVTYDSAKKYCAVVIEPLVRGCILLNEEISRSKRKVYKYLQVRSRYCQPKTTRTRKTNSRSRRTDKKSRTPIKPTISRRPNKLFSNKYGRRK